MNVASLERCKELYELSDVMNLDGEVWKPVVGLEHLFEVSSFGRLRSIYRSGITNGRIRKLYKDKLGYMWVSYNDKHGRKRNLSIHRAVAEAFVANDLHKPVVNHLDSNPSHNCIHNLEWCTIGENVEHSRNNGKANRYMNRGENHGMALLDRNKVINIRHCKGAISGRQLARLYKVADQTIYDIWNKRSWNHV